MMPGRAFGLSAAFGIGLMALTACSEMPTTGPTAREVHQQAKEIGGFYLIEVTPAVLKILAATPRPTLADEFGSADPATAAPVQLIGPGDTVAISIWEAGGGGLFAEIGSSQSSQTNATPTGAHFVTLPNQLVDRSGRVKIPFAPAVEIANKDPIQAAQTIEAALGRLANQPQAMVSIVQSASNFVTVAGDVAHPGRFPLDYNGTRLLDAIALGGGSTAPSYDMAVQLTRAGKSRRIRLSSVFGNPRQNIYLTNGDLLELIHDPMSVTVLGATTKNAQIEFNAEKLSLAETLGQAGGLVDIQADPTGVFILRDEPVSVLLALNATVSRNAAPSWIVPVILHTNLQDTRSLLVSRGLQMQDKDIVYVATSESVQFEKVVHILRDLAVSAGVLTNTGNVIIGN